jgi:hypothetical protein
MTSSFSTAPVADQAPHALDEGLVIERMTPPIRAGHRRHQQIGIDAESLWRRLLALIDADPVGQDKIAHEDAVERVRLARRVAIGRRRFGERPERGGHGVENARAARRLQLRPGEGWRLDRG